jgi:hypothetical protein
MPKPIIIPNNSLIGNGSLPNFTFPNNNSNILYNQSLINNTYKYGAIYDY